MAEFRAGRTHQRRMCRALVLNHAWMMRSYGRRALGRARRLRHRMLPFRPLTSRPAACLPEV